MSEGAFVEIDERRGKDISQIRQEAKKIEKKIAGTKKIKRERLPPTHPDYQKIEKKSPVWEPWRQGQVRHGAGRSTKEGSEESTG
jgi:hypothetical protein